MWDFRRPDADLRLAREYGFDWCYFPHYAFPPKWYRDQVPFTRIQCLEHGQPVQAFSPWESRERPSNTTPAVFSLALWQP